MHTLLRSTERGHLNHGWLDTYHTFSFGQYFNPKRRGFRSLRVVNEDFVAPGTGFGEHGHREMEILTFIVAGELTHRDSLGHKQAIRPGLIQHMSAGTGIRHAEFNDSKAEAVHLYQIWIEPAVMGVAPSYAEAAFPQEDGLVLLAGPADSKAPITIQQDALVYRGQFCGSGTARIPVGTGRGLWIQVVAGTVESPVGTLTAGDGLQVEDETELLLSTLSGAEFLVFDLK
jgi:quercetin 2,3-dioxygenase